MFASPDEILAALDPEQREVASTLRGAVAVIAGAGTGKTRAITHRIAYGVATGVYRPTSVLAVTFTTRAAGELRGRLQRLGVSGVQARTFHSAALRQAQYFWPRAYGAELPRVLENKMSLVADSANRLRVAIDTPRLRDLVSEISWAKVSNVAPEDYARLAGQHRRSVSSMDPETVGRVFESYEAIKRSRDRIDFEDILLCAAALISEHPDVADQVRTTYRHLVVDEYQDVSPLQQALLDLWRGDRDDVCVVGDPAQTIHSFAGAKASFLTEFARRHRGATVIRLVRDYRSTPQVVGVANQVMDSGVRSGTAVRLQAQQPAGPAVEFASAADEQADAGQIADWLARLAQAGIEYREMAVLFRINANSPPLEQALADRQIPYLVRGGERFYERPEVRQALLTLRNEARASAPDAGLDVLEQVKAVLGALGWTPQPPNSAGAVRERWESLAALVAVAEDLVTEAGDTSGTLLEAIGSTEADGQPRIDLAAVSAELDRRADAQHVPTAQGVTLGTIHAAKGLEWDAVALSGVHEGSLPFVLATSPDELAEERRLLYVGITRARSRLRISWSLTRNGGGSTRRPSRFLDGVLPASLAHGADGGAGRQRRSSLTAHCRSCGKPLAGGAERKLGRHLDCPSTYDERTLALLKEWRKQEASQQSLPAYCIFTDATLVALAESSPSSRVELARVPGIGAVKIDKYGEAVLAIVAAGPQPNEAGSVGRES